LQGSRQSSVRNRARKNVADELSVMPAPFPDPKKKRGQTSETEGSELMCPRDGTSLPDVGDQLRCPSCGFTYGTPMDSDFVKGRTSYWGELQKSQMDEILEIAASRGYDEALLKAADLNSDLFPYLFSPSRIGWLASTPHDQTRHTCIDLGSGWGTMSFLLSSFFERVYSLDMVSERLEFQKIRRAQAGISNVRTVRAKFSMLPFAPSSADLIVGNGVLEWAAAEEASADPRKDQIKLLSSVRSILKPGGSVYVGIENRLGFQYFLGAKDHSRLRFTSLMPRWLAGLVVRASRRDGTQEEYRSDKIASGYRWPTYSLPGYAKLFGEAGFSDVSYYWAYPSYNDPRYLSSLSFDAPVRFLIDQSLQRRVAPEEIPIRAVLSLARRVTPEALLIIWRAFCPHFAIFARKPRNDDTAQHIDEVHPTSRQVLFMNGNNPSSGTWRVEFENGIPASKRQLIRTSETNSGELFAVGSPQTWIPGRLANLRLEFDRDLIRSWLRQFQSIPTSSISVSDILVGDSRQLGDYVANYSRNDAVLKRLLKEVADLAEEDWGNRPSIPEHGDFWSENIIIRERPNRDELYVIDREHTRLNGVPGYDQIFLILTASIRPLKLEGGLARNLAGSGRWAHELRGFLRLLANDAGLQQSLVPGLISYTILRVIHRSDPRCNTWNPNFALFRTMARQWVECADEFTLRYHSGVECD